jgi:elongation factor 1-gamma
VFVEKKKNPLELLPKSPFNIDDWKREFCNAEDKKATLQQLWGKFDHAGWSIWKIHYIKYEGEGVVGYLTNNLKNGHLRNIDHFRKYCFAVHGVYGVETNYEIDGIWFWRGTEIPEEWKEHQSYDYFTFARLDENDVNVQNLVAEYWLNLNEGDLVEGKPVFDAKWFK